MEVVFDYYVFDCSVGVVCVRIGLQFGVDVGDVCGQVDGFGVGVQVYEMGEWVVVMVMVDFGVQGSDEVLL